jgi:hypothetical protein
MATPIGPLARDALLSAVGDAMSALHERYHHRPPGTVQCRLMGDDLLACVLGGVYTDVEKTLIELERAPLVQDNRNAFQTAMQDRFVAASNSSPGSGSRTSSPRTASAPISRSSSSSSPTGLRRERAFDCASCHIVEQAFGLSPARVALNRRRLAGPDRALLIRR